MLTSKQVKCLKLMVLGRLKQTEIAKQIKVSENTICNWKKCEEFMSEYKRLLNVSIQSVAAKAFQTHTSLLNSKNDMVKYVTAKDILDRAGFKPDGKASADGVMNISFEGETDLE